MLVVGLQFYHASKILLATHNPPDALFSNALDFNKHVEVYTYPLLSHLVHRRQMTLLNPCCGQAKILMHVRMLCAISFSNDHYGCRINASHLIAMGGSPVLTSLFPIMLLLILLFQVPGFSLEEKSNGVFKTISICCKMKKVGLVGRVRRCCKGLGRGSRKIRVYIYGVCCGL